MRSLQFKSCVLVSLLFVWGVLAASAAGTEFFDDFNYASGGGASPIDPQFQCFGWYARTEAGGPGPMGATWRADYVTWVDDPAIPGNRLMRLRASTDGTATGTSLSEVGTNEDMFFQGTYAARIRFVDPAPGAGQPSVQAFATYKGLLCDLNYSECDVEYTPLDPWSTRCGSVPALHLQTWEQYCDNPYLLDMMPADPSPVCGSLAGWHTVAIQIGGGTVRYYMDGLLRASHGGAYYPESTMRILLMHWFAAQLNPGVTADMTIDVDWVYYAQDTILTSAQVEALVGQYRAYGITRFNALSTFDDCNGNFVPDYCESDSDQDGIIDDCDTTKVWRVKWNATGAGTGLSWFDAFTTIQAALAVAQPGDEIWVAAGTYRPAPPGGDRNLSFQLVSGVAVYGGFAGTELQRSQRDRVLNPTVLSGDLNGDDGPMFAHTAENSYTVVKASATDTDTRLDGFTIRGGSGSYGGGLFFDGGDLTVSGCWFLANSALYGGAVCILESTPVISNCYFGGNRALSDGGAVYVDLGSDPRISASVFEYNQAAYAGGAVRAVTSAPSIISCKFWGNRAQYGGAVQHYESTGPILANCLLNGNVATGYGGAIHNTNSSPFVINCTVVGNSAELGGGLLGWAPSLATVVNSIFWGNSDLSGTGEAAQITTVSASLSYSCIQNWTGVAGGTAVSGADPLFVDPDGRDNVPGNEDDDFRLRAASPYIDAGDNTILPPDITDLDADGNTTEPIALDVNGYPRLEDAPLVLDTGWGTAPLVDIGAHEYGPGPLADFDYDQDVDLSDLAHLQACDLGPAIPQTDPLCQDADLDSDGDVDQEDFGIFQRCYSGEGNPADPNCEN